MTRMNIPLIQTLNIVSRQALQTPERQPGDE
jgi:hypothetical protein